MSLKLNHSLRMTMGIGLALILMQGALSWIIVNSFRTAIMENVEKQQLALVNTLAHDVDDKIRDHLRLISSLAMELGVDHFGNLGEAREFVERHGKVSSFDHGIFLFDAEGKLLAAHSHRRGTPLGDDFSGRSYLKEVIGKRRAVVSEPYICSVNGDAVVMFAAPVVKGGRLVGVLGGALNLLHDNFLSNIAQARIGSGGYLYLFGPDRTMIVHPDQRRILKADPAPGVNLLYDRALSGFEGSGETVTSGGVKAVTSFKALQGAPWILAANFPVEEAYRPLRKAVRNLLLALSFTVAGSGVALYLVARRLKGEVSLRAEAEDYARLILDSVDEGVLGITSSGTISFVNRGAMALLDYQSAGELLGRDAREVLHRTHPRCLNCKEGECRIYPAFAAGTSHYSDDERLSRKDGSCFLADFSAIPVWSGEKLRGAVMTFRDTSETRETEARLRLQSAALEAAASSILIADHDSRIIWVNRAFTRQTGYSAEEALGRNPVSLLSAEEASNFVEDLVLTLGEKRPWHGVMSSRRKDGTLYDEDVSITPLLDEQGEITHFIGIMPDVTERKRSEEALLQGKRALEGANRRLTEAMDRAHELTVKAERASKAKSEFLANMSHEIRTPMNAIIVAGHLLGETELTSRQNEYLQTLTISAESLLGIIDDILDFSKIEAGRLEIEKVNFATRQLVEEVVTVFRMRARQKGIELAVEVAPEMPEWLLGDRLRLTQVLNNLLGNALKFTMEGSISLQVAVASRRGREVELEFSVRDTGIGISAQDQAQLFQPFTQVDGSNTRTYGGTGLGLAISRRLTSLMGGRIWCDSTAGVGSTFFFRVPFIAGEEGKTPDSGSKASAGSRFEGQRILLVEDNVFNQQVAVALLQNRGLEVTVASNGVEAVDLVSRLDFDLVLMDIQMPVMDGLTATRHIRQLPRGGVAALPILAVSANAAEQDVKESLEAGMNGHITKPYDPIALYRAIELWTGFASGKVGDCRSG